MNLHFVLFERFLIKQKLTINQNLSAKIYFMAFGVKLVEKFGAELHECAFMAELEFLKGRSKLPEGKVYSLLKF